MGQTYICPLFCDNLEAEVTAQFQSAVKGLDGVVWYGPAGAMATDIWQPVVCGYGRLLKSLIQAEQGDWLWKEDNIDLWLGNSEDPLDANKRRILSTHYDYEAERDYTRELVGRKWKKFYENGFFVKTTSWYSR